MNLPTIEKIQTDLTSLSSHEVLLFGSYIEGGFGPNSDIDIAVITRISNKDMNEKTLKQYVGHVPDHYDVNIFELLPIKVKYSILTKYMVLFGDKLEISEYLYRFRKIWNDCKHRIFENQFESVKERVEVFQRINN